MGSFAGHSMALYALIGGAALLIGLIAYVIAYRYGEGLPPLLDALLSMSGFLGIFGALYFGQQIGAHWGHPFAGKVVAITAVIVTVRILRVLLGREYSRHRKNSL